ncbi:hypothetical protein ASG43_13265 [Aureimonas sp. Leaf454]|uniref:imelysin family protein n=1 Tax=Aureimonas sp. Leaf454 TaxID=1736381 RepID=UPI00070080C1|nr:imelysin family protein [Aureimonas sp. Leaf454]KQT45241.1 hypothetical protein ASG43_13265 [Aureimonas sp. Leaf454]
MKTVRSPASRRFRRLASALVLALLFGASLSGAFPLSVMRSAGAAEPASASPGSAEKTAIVRRAVEEVFRPAYRDLAVRAADMTEAQGALCSSPSTAALLEARKRFAGLVTSFSRTEFVRFGPIMEDNRIERLLFWPDRRGIALRQVQGLLGAQDESATSVAGLHAKSVAVQGLNALEFVLFGSGAEDLGLPSGDFRCRYGAAIAGNLSAMAETISAGWQSPDGIVKALTEPSATSPAYREIDDSLDEILGTFVHGFEAIRDLRIRPAFGETIGDAAPKAWIYGRSELTEASLQTNFAGLSELYDRSGIAGLLPPSERWMEASIAFEFGNAGRAFQTIAMPLAIASGDPKRRDRVGYLLILTQSLQDLFANQFAPAVGLKAGFSSLDGD